MRKGCSISGWLALLVLLGLSAVLFYAGGIRSRSEVDRLTGEVVLSQEAIIHYHLILEQKDMVIVQQDSMISALRQDVVRYNWMYLESAKSVARLKKEFEAYKASRDSIKYISVVPWFTDWCH